MTHQFTIHNNDTFIMNTLFNKPLTPDLLRILSQCKYLVCSPYFNQSIDDLPNSIISIELGHNFNTPINHYPNNLKVFKAGYKFNQPINNLPPSVISVIIKGQFNQSVNNLPTNLKILILGDKFNRPINSLPRTIIILHLGHAFNRNIYRLPPRLMVLKLGYSFNKPMINLPYSLIHLECGGKINLADKSRYQLHKNIKYLKVSYCRAEDFIDNLDYGLHTLHIETDFSSPKIVANLPLSIQRVIISTWSCLDFTTYAHDGLTVDFIYRQIPF